MAAQGDRLYDALEFILNQATEEELEVIRAALKRRIEGGEGRGPMGLNPARLARETAASVKRQLGGSLESIRDMIRRFAVEVIRKEAPELSEEQVGGLLDAWVPEPGRTAASGAQGSEATSTGKGLSPEVMLTLISQFVAYATEGMPISEQIKLHDEIPGWQQKYWERFSPRVRELVSLFLSGALDRSAFWERVAGELGIDLPSGEL